MKSINQSVVKTIVQIVEREKDLIKKQEDIMSRFESAENLGQTDEMTNISLEGAELDKKIKRHIGQKAILMTLVIGNYNFKDN